MLYCVIQSTKFCFSFELVAIFVHFVQVNGRKEFCPDEILVRTPNPTSYNSSSVTCNTLHTIVENSNAILNAENIKCFKQQLNQIHIHG